MMFSPASVERAQPATTIEDTLAHEAPLHEETQVQFDTHMTYLEVHEEVKTSEKIIQEKEVEIRELKDKFSKAYFMITFLQQENKQLQVK